MGVAASEESRPVHGMSLVGLLMIIVTLGLFSAGAIVGLSTMTGPNNNEIAASGGTNPGAGGRGSRSVIGESSLLACRANADAAVSASTYYFTSNGSTLYPRTWSDLTTSTPPVFELPSSVVINGANPQELDGPGWKLIMSGGGPNPTTFACS